MDQGQGHRVKIMVPTERSYQTEYSCEIFHAKGRYSNINGRVHQQGFWGFFVKIRLRVRNIAVHRNWDGSNVALLTNRKGHSSPRENNSP